MKCNRQIFLSFWTAFCPLLPPNNPKNQNFEKKNTYRYYHFTHVYHKGQSHNVWFLRYGAWWTKIFVILDCFLPFYLNNNLKNKNFEKMEKISKRYYHFKHMYYKWQSYDVCFLRYRARRTEFFVIWTIFCPFTP